MEYRDHLHALVKRYRRLANNTALAPHAIARIKAALLELEHQVQEENGEVRSAIRGQLDFPG
jgi:hypothetical protein